MDEPYHFFAFDNPLEALSALEAKEFAVVGADQSMSEMDARQIRDRSFPRNPEYV